MVGFTAPSVSDLVCSLLPWLSSVDTNTSSGEIPGPKHRKRSIPEPVLPPSRPSSHVPMSKLARVHVDVREGRHFKGGVNKVLNDYMTQFVFLNSFPRADFPVTMPGKAEIGLNYFNLAPGVHLRFDPVEDPRLLWLSTTAEFKDGIRMIVLPEFDFDVPSALVMQQGSCLIFAPDQNILLLTPLRWLGTMAFQ